MSLPTQQLQIVFDFLKTNYRFDTFQEPRGVMRIFQLIFSIWGFFACRDFSITLDMKSEKLQRSNTYQIDYPFEFQQNVCQNEIGNQTVFVSVDSSTGAQFFVATAILSLLYALYIIFVYAYLDEMYKSKPEFPMADFALTAILALFWLIATFAFSSGGSALEKTFDQAYLADECTRRCFSDCYVSTTSFRDLTIALMIGFLNFFLWTTDLWFLYKETIWFQQRNQILNQQMYGQQQFGGQQQQQQFVGETQYDQQQQPQQQQFGYTEQPQQYGYTEQNYGQQSYGQPPI